MFDRIFEGMAWVLAFFFDITHSYGVSIILLTLAVMLVVTPLTLKGTKSMMAMQQYQPEIRRIQQEFKGDRARLNEELLKFYRENNINPMGSCLPLLIQAPIFIVLFRAIRGLTRHGADGTFDPKYLNQSTELFKSLVGKTKMPFLGIDLSQSALDTLRNRSFLSALPYLLIVGIVAGSSYVQQRQVSGRNPGAMTPQQKSLMRIVPLFSATVMWFPAALGIYWVTSNACRVVTQWYISRSLYGIRRGQPAPERPGTVIEGRATLKASEEPGPAKRPTNPKPSNPKPSTSANGTRPRTSGRVTEPKRRPETSRPPGRPVPGRRGPDAPRPGGNRSERPKRRVPNPSPGNGPGATGRASSGEQASSEPDERKKRRG